MKYEIINLIYSRVLLSSYYEINFKYHLSLKNPCLASGFIKLLLFYCFNNPIIKFDDLFSEKNFNLVFDKLNSLRACSRLLQGAVCWDAG